MKPAHSGQGRSAAILIVLSVLCVLSAQKPAASKDAQGGLPVMHAWYRLFDHSAQVTLDYSGTDPKLYSGAKLEAVCRTKSGQELGRTSSRHMPTRLLGIPLKEKLPDGDYDVEAAITDASGKTTNFTLPFSRKRSEWEDNGIGVTDKVIPPWVPMTVKGNTVTCWGREYTFGALGLPSQILSTQPEPTRGAATKKLLASPVTVVVETDKGRMRWTAAQPVIHQRSEGYVNITAASVTKGGEITAKLSGALEYDGFYKFTLRLEPSKPITVRSVRLEIPLPDDLGLLFNVAGENMRGNNAFLNIEGKPDGELWNSYNPYALQEPYLTYSQKRELAKGTGPGGGFKRYGIGTFYPHLWIGDDDRGIAFLGESDRGWQINYTKPCQDVIRVGGKTVLRLILVNEPAVLDRPIETTLSLQATPVKPRPKGGSWRKWQTYGWSNFDKPSIWNQCFDDYDKGKGYIWYVNKEAEEQKRWWRYFCHCTDRIEHGIQENLNDTSDYLADWMAHKEEWHTGQGSKTYGPESARVASNVDWNMWVYKQWHDRAGMDGIYYDNTFAHICKTLGPGIAWEDETGEIHYGFTGFVDREFMKRVRTYFTSVGPAPVLNTHMSDAPIVGYLGFSDFWLDGENGGRPDITADRELKWEKALDFVDRWGNPGGLANLRVTIGRQWGVVPKFLFSWKMDPTYAVLGMFDLDYCFLRMNGLGDSFGMKEEDVVFVPYWDNRKWVTVADGGTEVLPTLWTRAGRARVLISNLSRHDRTVDIKLDMNKLGLPKDAVAVDDQTGDTVEIAGGSLRNLLVNGHNYRTVLVASPGVFAHNPSGNRLVHGTRIERLCDDFATLDGWKLLGKNADPWNGTLKIPGPPCSLARRTFGEDNCSVQIRVQCGNGPVWTNLYWRAYPKLMLYWKQGTYLGVSAGYGQPTPNGKFNQSFASLDGKPVESAIGPAAGVVNWLRITLKPDQVEFYSSTDGETWDKIDTMPRAGYTGAPAYLFVGRGDITGPDELAPCNEDGDGTSCFDNLVTWQDATQ